MSRLLLSATLGAAVLGVAALALTDSAPAYDIPSILPITAAHAQGQRPRLDVTGPTAARVDFPTRVPVVYTVVVGETEAFGRLIEGPDLDGLKPDTTYYFRVQGVAADGTIYLGETRSFRTDPQAAPAPS